jgi:hypothetical protein
VQFELRSEPAEPKETLPERDRVPDTVIWRVAARSARPFFQQPAALCRLLMPLAHRTSFSPDLSTQIASF